MSEFQLNSLKWTKFSFDRHNFPNYHPSVVQKLRTRGNSEKKKKKNKRLPYGR